MLTDEQIAQFGYAHSDEHDEPLFAFDRAGFIACVRAILARQPAAIDKEPVAEVVMEPFDTWPRLKFVSVESMRNVEAGDMLYATPPSEGWRKDAERREALEEAIQIIETHRVPVGNSPAGEMAAGWTMDALHEIRDAIRALSQPPSKD